MRCIWCMQMLLKIENQISLALPGAPMLWASTWPWLPVAVTQPPSRSSWHPWGETTWRLVRGFENRRRVIWFHMIYANAQGSFRGLWQGENRQTWIKQERLQEEIWNYCQKKIRACLFCNVNRKKELELDSVQTSGSNFKKQWKLCDLCFMCFIFHVFHVFGCRTFQTFTGFHHPDRGQFGIDFLGHHGVVESFVQPLGSHEVHWASSGRFGPKYRNCDAHRFNQERKHLHWVGCNLELSIAACVSKVFPKCH